MRPVAVGATRRTSSARFVADQEALAGGAGTSRTADFAAMTT
jgi:hypothetical protein